MINNLSHADYAKGAEIYLHTEYTEFHRIIGSTYLHVSTRNISHAKAQSFAKRLRCSAVSACNNFHTESTEDTEKSPRICAYLLVFFLSHEWARIFTNAMRSGIVSRRRLRRLSQKRTHFVCACHPDGNASVACISA